MLYVSTKLCEIISNSIKIIADTISILKITKGNNSSKNVGEVTVANPCMLSGHALYFNKFCEIILKGIKVIEWTISILKITKGNNSAKM